MANDIKAVVYTSITGHDYVVGLNSEVFAQDDGGDPAVPLVGGADYTGTPVLDGMPRNMRPRQVQVRNAAGITRYVMCLEATAPLWSGAETQITLEDSDGASSTYDVIGQLAEKQRKRKASG